MKPGDIVLIRFPQTDLLVKSVRWFLQEAERYHDRIQIWSQTEWANQDKT